MEAIAKHMRELSIALSRRLATFTNVCIAVAWAMLNLLSITTSILIGVAIDDTASPSAHATEAATTPNSSCSTNMPPLGDSTDVSPYIDEIARAVVPYVNPPRDIDVELWFNDVGAVIRVRIFVPSQAKYKPLSNEEYEEARGLVAQLGAEKYATREGATRRLRELGPDIVPLLKAYKATTRDPEVLHRCEKLITTWLVDIPEDKNADIIARFTMPRLPSARVANKRVVIRILQLVLEAAKSPPDEILEMLPGAPIPMPAF